MSLNPVQEITNDPHVTYTGFDQTIVTVANGTLTPVRVGETHVLVTLTDAQGALDRSRLTGAADGRCSSRSPTPDRASIASCGPC